MLLEIIQGLVLLRSNVQGQFTAVGSVRWTAAQLCFHSPCTRKQLCSEVNLRENRTQKHSTNTYALSVSIWSFNSAQHCSNVTPAQNRTHAFIKSVIHTQTGVECLALDFNTSICKGLSPQAADYKWHFFKMESAIKRNREAHVFTFKTQSPASVSLAPCCSREPSSCFGSVCITHSLLKDTQSSLRAEELRFSAFVLGKERRLFLFAYLVILKMKW